jgi:aldose 1-epimerase
VQSDVRQHQLQILPDGICRWKATVFRVANSKMLLTPALISAAENHRRRFPRDDDQQKVKGYDHAFLLQAKGDASQPAAQVWSQDEKLQMTVYTSAPALQFYSGNYLGGTPSRRRSPTPTGRVWRWRASSCRIRRTIRNGRSRTACCARAKSTSA